MAILVYPMETIQELNQEGWPVQPGDIGENLTVEGYAHDSFKVGQQYIAGDATIEISLECDPCTNLGLLPYVGQKHTTTFIKTIYLIGLLVGLLNEFEYVSWLYFTILGYPGIPSAPM